MAELAPLPSPPAHTTNGLWTSAQTRAQFSAIAWLRWRIFANSFRRKGSTGELIGIIITYPIAACLALAPVLGSGFGAYLFTTHHHPRRISWLLWAIFILCQLLNIQLGQPGTTFDPTQLIRFPMRLRNYTAVRLFFGLLSPANVLGTLMSFAVAVGIIAAAPALWLYALIALAVFAATNVLFSRMIFAWIDRWLSTRRAREVFTAIIFAGSLGIQWANFKFNPAYNHHQAHTHNISQQRVAQQHVAWIGHLYQHAQPWLAAMPPELASTSLIKAAQHALPAFAGYTLAAALYGTLFLLIFALRMRTEFRGENLSDAARVSPQKTAKRTALEPTTTHAPTTFAPAINNTQATPATTPTDGTSSLIANIIGKEVLYVRRNTGILYGLIMPIFLVLIFVGKFAARSGSSLWVFPAAVAYTLLAICPLSYNSFGFEAAGAQLYFLAPIRMRDVFLAKNLLSVLMALLEMALIFVIVTYMSGRPSLKIALASVLWAIGTIAINLILGNRRSLSSPKKIDVQKMSRRQASQLSAFISMGILLVSSGLAAGLYGLCFWQHQMWAVVPIFAIFAAVCISLYLRSLNSMERYALDHREELFAELCKQT
jgi:ABC-2 type transport system permease protein